MSGGCRDVLWVMVLVQSTQHNFPFKAPLSNHLIDVCVWINWGVSLYFVELTLKGLNVLWLGKHSSERIGRFSVTVYMNRPLLTLKLIIWIIRGLDNVTWNQTLCFFNQIVFPLKTRFSISILVGALPPTNPHCGQLMLEMREQPAISGGSSLHQLISRYQYLQ